MLPDRALLHALVSACIGPTNSEIAHALTAVSLYKDDPEAFERMMGKMGEIGFTMPSTDKIKGFLKKKLDELEAENVLS